MAVEAIWTVYLGLWIHCAKSLPMDPLCKIFILVSCRCYVCYGTKPRAFPVCKSVSVFLARGVSSGAVSGHCFPPDSGFPPAIHFFFTELGLILVHGAGQHAICVWRSSH